MLQVAQDFNKEFMSVYLCTPCDPVTQNMSSCSESPITKKCVSIGLDCVVVTVFDAKGL